jgi:hypothetical protein
MRIFTSVTRISVISRIAVLGALAAMLCVPSAARAAQFPSSGGDSGPSGYRVQVNIHFYGSGVKGRDVHDPVWVHPSCWWAPADGPYTDAVAMLAWYDAVTGKQQTRGNLDLYGPRSEWKREADAEAAGTADISWYQAHCDDPSDYTKFGVGGLEVGDPIEGNPVNFVTFLYHPFNVGERIPDPLVSAEEMARLARNHMDIQVPELSRNPMIDAPGAPTLVGLPTWFWVGNPLSVGIDPEHPNNPVGTLDVTAELDQPDGRVWATVTAKTGGLSLDSAYGGNDCAPTRAVVKYGPGVADSAACTVVFGHASTGLQVTASTAWNAFWVGAGHPQPTGLAGLTQAGNIAVAVAEVQNIVIR